MIPENHDTMISQKLENAVQKLIVTICSLFTISLDFLTVHFILLLSTFPKEHAIVSNDSPVQFPNIRTSPTLFSLPTTASGW